MIVSSQHTTQQEIVDNYIVRIQNGEIFTAEICSIESDECAEWNITALLIDGHHRIQAYKQLGMQIEFVESDINLQSELDDYGLDALLENHWNDGDYYDISTGYNVF